MAAPLLKEYFQGDNTKPYMRVYAGLNYIKSNKLPYFSITAATADSSGCLHDKIVNTSPEYKDIISFHLSDINGKPLHAVENGWYWIKEKNVDNVKSHFRLSTKEAKNMIETFTDKFQVFKYVESMERIWKIQADELIEKYDLKVFGDNYIPEI